MSAGGRYASTWLQHRADPSLPMVNGLTTRRAVFRPKRVDTLRPEWIAFIGRHATWRCCGGVESGPHDGQVAWDAAEPGWPPHWVPDEDLEETTL